MIRRIALLCCLLFPTLTWATLNASCESALRSLFQKEVSKSEASDFLKVQGDLTLHRMAWAYLKAQKADHSQKLESVERTILSLLDQKYTATNPGFIKARNQFEAQPLSREALAEIGPYLKEVLTHQFGSDSKLFILNTSDLKLLHSIAKFERETVDDGKYDTRMLSRRAPAGMLNFTKLVNAQYKKHPDSMEKDIDVDLKLKGLEKTIGGLQKKINTFLRYLEVPLECQKALACTPGDHNLSEFFAQNENIQDIFWKSLGEKLTGDDVLMDNLSYGKIWLNGASSEGGPVASSTGLYLKDPVSIILKDGQNRTPAAYKHMDRAYVNKMADAILKDDRVFELDGKIYSRKTGRVLSEAEMIQMLPDANKNLPQKTPESLKDKASAALDGVLHRTPAPKLIPQKSSKYYNEQMTALLNGEKTFVYGKDLYTLDGKRIDPATKIAEVMGNKSGTKVSAERYQNFDPGYLLVRAEALSNNQPHFKLGNQVYDSETGKNLTSPTRITRKTQDVKIQKQRRVQYQYLSDEETIINFHRDQPNKSGCQHYAIVDKKNAEVSVYTLNGEKVFSREVLIGKTTTDEKTIWTNYNDREHQTNYATGAGAFTIGEPKQGAYYKDVYDNNLLQVEDQRVFAIHQVPLNLPERNQLFGTTTPEERRVSGGCVNLLREDFLAFAGWIKPTCKVYVLPEEPNNRFIVKDNKLELHSSTAVKNVASYNYPNSPSKYQPIEISINNEAGKTAISERFVKTLASEKEYLMGHYNLSNDEYNDLASVAYGIMGNESEFGMSKGLWVKELSPTGVITAKAAKDVINLRNPFHASSLNLSKGYTQIKDIPMDKDLADHYPMLSKATLMDPKLSAVATMAYLVGAVRTLKSVGEKNKDDDRKIKITRENLIDYVGYIYQGRKKALSSVDTTTNGNFNKYTLSLKKNMSYIDIAQKIE